MQESPRFGLGVLTLWMATVVMAVVLVQVIRERPLESSATSRAASRAQQPALRALDAPAARRSPQARDDRPRAATVASGEVRRDQARVLWGKGWGRLLHARSFREYLKGIPEVPVALRTATDRFPDLILVDHRPFLMDGWARAAAPDRAIRWSDACDRLDVGCSRFIYGITRADPTSARVPAAVYWMRMQDGHRYDGRTAKEARAAFAADEVGVTALELLSYYAQQSPILRAPDRPSASVIGVGTIVPAYVAQEMPRFAVLTERRAVFFRGRDVELALQTTQYERYGAASRWNPPALASMPLPSADGAAIAETPKGAPVP